MDRVRFGSLAQVPDPRALQAWWSDYAPDAGPLNVNESRSTWDEEISLLPADVHRALDLEEDWSWAVYPWLQTATLVPSPELTYAILTSRNYPIVTREEQRALNDSYVIVVGLSTGRAVAQTLARMGISKMLLIDGDHLAPSNTNRLVGTRLTDTGIPKVVSAARELWEFNPYLDLKTHKGFLDGASLRSFCEEELPTVIVEVIDELPAKVSIRRVAREFGIPVVMPTTIDWDPMVDIDFPDEPMFGGRLTEAEIAVVEDPTASFGEKTEVAMRIIHLDEWAPRSLLSGQLAQSGIVSFWSQTIPAVSVGAALVARAVLDIVRGSRTPESRVGVSIRDLFRTDDPIDQSEPLVKILKQELGDVD